MNVDAGRLDRPDCALAIGAHPDDIEFGAGATLASWARRGATVHLLVCTDGSKGSWDPGDDLAHLVARRQQEQREAAARLGARHDVVFLGWPDGELESGIRQRWEIAYWIRKLRPGVVLGHDPWKRYRLHPDHRHAGFLTVDGVVAARDPHFFPEQELAPHRPQHLLLWEADTEDHWEPVEAADVEAKLAALEAHRSQLRSTMGIADSDDPTQRARFHRRIRERLARSGAAVGAAYAEAFAHLSPL